MARFRTQRTGEPGPAKAARAASRRYTAEPLDRIALALGIVAVALLMCVVLVVISKPTTSPATANAGSVVEGHASPVAVSAPIQQPVNEPPAPVTQSTAADQTPTPKPEPPQPAPVAERRVEVPEPIVRTKLEEPKMDEPRAEPATDTSAATELVARVPKTDPPLTEKSPIVVEKADPEMRQWTYTSGESFQGKFIRFRDNKVVIQSPNAKVDEIHPSQLSQEDREWYMSRLRAKREAEGDEWRARIAHARSVPKAAKHNRVVRRTGTASAFNTWNNPWNNGWNNSGWNNGFRQSNYFPRGYSYYPNGYSNYPSAYFGGYGFGNPQYIRQHIYIAPSRDQAEPEDRQQP